MATEDQDRYLLSRNYVDSIRLNLQHYLWNEMFGYLLHPRIPRSDDVLKVADIGAGTGLWLADLSREVSNKAQLDGFDIDTSQATPKGWLPSNVDIHKWDVTTEAPLDLLGRYDIVHVRLFIFVVVKDPVYILRNLMKLLKPGGWLQWAEPNLETMSIAKTDTTNPSKALEEMYRLTALRDPRLNASWVKDLPAVFAAEGFEQVESCNCMGSGHHSFAMHECNLLIYDMVNEHGPRPEAEEISKLVPEAAWESRNGAMYTFERLVVIGRKPGP